MGKLGNARCTSKRLGRLIRKMQAYPSFPPPPDSDEENIRLRVCKRKPWRWCMPRAMRSSADAQSNDGAPDLVPADVERVPLLVDDLMRWIHCPN